MRLILGRHHATLQVAGRTDKRETPMSRILMLVLAVLLCSTSPLQAKGAEKKAIVADTPEKFELLVEAIRQEMEPGKRYEFLNTYNRGVVNDGLDRMGEMLQEAGSVDAMSQEEKTKLFSIQEKVNGVLANNAADRRICTHRAPTGSHIPMTECKTVRELHLRRAEGRRKLKDMEDRQRALDQPTWDPKQGG